MKMNILKRVKREERTGNEYGGRYRVGREWGYLVVWFLGSQ